MRLLTSEAVAPMLGMSRRKLLELTRTERIPFRRLPHGRRLLFQEDWLVAWADGAELERIELPGDGLIIRPRAGA